MKTFLFLILSGGILLLISCGSGNSDIFRIHEQYYPVSINNDTLFFKLEIWGISNNHDRVILSKEKKQFNEHDPKHDYVFSGMLPLAFKSINEEIHIYSFTKAKIPIDFGYEVNIVQQKVTKLEFEKIVEEIEGITVIDYPSTPSSTSN